MYFPLSFHSSIHHIAPYTLLSSSFSKHGTLLQFPPYVMKHLTQSLHSFDVPRNISLMPSIQPVHYPLLNLVNSSILFSSTFLYYFIINLNTLTLYSTSEAHLLTVFIYLYLSLASLSLVAFISYLMHFHLASKTRSSTVPISVYLYSSISSSLSLSLHCFSFSCNFIYHQKYFN